MEEGEKNSLHHRGEKGEVRKNINYTTLKPQKYIIETKRRMTYTKKLYYIPIYEQIDV